MSVTPVEALIAIQVAKGEWADGRALPEADRVVSADFVRRILTAMPLPQSDHQAITDQQPAYAPFCPAGDFAPLPMAASGLRLRGATIEGLLDLTNCTSQGGAPLPALSLEACRLLGRRGISQGDLQDDGALLSLDLSGASIVSVSLRDSAFTHVAMFHARVAGAVDISGVKPLNGWTDRDPGGVDMAAFRRAVKAAAGELRDRGGQTAFEDLRPAATGAAGAREPSAMHPHDYCWLDLSGSHIGGSILAQQVRLRAPRRDRTGPMHTPSWPRFALRLEAVEVAGTLDARGGSVFDGGLSLYIAEIRDEVWLGSGRVLKEQGVAIDAQGARLGGVWAVADPPLSVLGMVILNSSRIAGHVNLQAADLDGDGGPSLMAEAATIGGDLTLGAGVAARGPVGMSGTSIGGTLDLRGAILSGRIEPEGDGRVSRECCDAIHGRNLSVGSDAFLSDGFIAHGCVGLDGARVGDHFDLRGATLAGTVPNRYQDRFALRRDGAFVPSVMSVAALSCSDMSVGGCVRMGSSRPKARMFFAQGSVNLQRASIGKDLDIINARITRAPSAASDSPVLDLGWVAVSGTLILSANHFDGVVHLEHASTNILSDDQAGYGGATSLMLNGFQYQAFYEPPDDHESPPEAQLVEARKTWLRRMPHYRPQPYANLASVFIRDGRPDEARDILVEKYRRERKARIRRLSGALLRKRPGEAVRIALISAASWLWGLMFGYGLKPSRAMATLTVAFLVGWAFFFFANTRPAMVVDQQPIAGYVIGDQMGAPLATADIATSVECGTSISEALYALDVFIPLVDLRQESKCEIGRAGNAALFEGVVLFQRVVVPGEIEIYRFVKAIYALSGWLLISLAILTFSGVLQRRDAEA